LAGTSQQGDVITVEGYSRRYAAAVERVLQAEGGLVDDPSDRGGTTKFGISLRFLAAEGAFDADGDGKADFDLDMDGDIDRQDIRKLSRGDAVYLYHTCFWQRLQAETFPAPIGEMLFDQAVNGGLVTARKLLQRAINNVLLQSPGAQRGTALLAVDGKIGLNTRAALQAVLGLPWLGTAALVESFRDAAKERYRQIATRYPAQKRFLAGWLARADRLGR